ncbi:MAG: glycerophosphodiester phosphodiesterase family protein [bacterium]|nr:glycerophosphodiester phosphodiesterase family protein [bacterium]
MKKNLDFLTSSVIAHRGMHNINKNILENSIEAFRLAIKNNFIIELDLHIIKDGSVVVFHDDNLKRLTGVDKKIKDLNYDELSRLKLINTEDYIPLFKDVLKVIDGKVPIIIELKSDSKSYLLEKEVLRLLENYKGIFAIQSFNPFSIYYIRKKSPNVIIGQLSSDFRNKKMLKLKKIILKNMLFNYLVKPDFISYDIRSLPSKRIKKLSRTKLILGWTVKNNKDYIKAKKYCDNFICENIKDYIR